MTALRLVQSADVVQFPTVSTFEDAWNARAGMMRKRGDGREKTRKLWNRAAAKVGQRQLLDALKRYLREEKEPTCGYPGLSVWLNGERYDHWVDANPTHGHTAASSTQARCPESYRSLLAISLGEPFVRSYLDPCTFEDGWIIPRTEYARKKLLEVKHVLKDAGIAGMKAKG